MTTRSPRRLAVPVLVTAVVGAVMATAVAFAVIPDAGGVIHGCRNKDTGRLRVIDDPAQHCTSKERPLDWYQRGQPSQRVFIVGNGTTDAASHVTNSTDFVDVGEQYLATLTVEAGDRVEMRFEANTNRFGDSRIFQYFTFNINGVDVLSPGQGGLIAHHNHDQPGVSGIGTGHVSFGYEWTAPSDGAVTVKPRFRRNAGTGDGDVMVVNNGDVNPRFSVVNHRH